MHNSPADHFLDVANHRQHVVDWGGPAESGIILLVHGAASSAKIWNLVAPALAQHYRVVAVDQRSHGLTDLPADRDFSFAAVSGDLACVCDRLNIDRALFVGHSWGGNVVVEYATRHAERVAGAVMIDGGFLGISKVLTWPQFETAAAPPKWSGVQLSDVVEHVKGLWGSQYRPEVLDEITATFVVRSDQTVSPHLAFEDHIAILRAMWEQHAKTVYGQVKCPSLFIACEPPTPHDAQTEQSLLWKRRMVLPFIQTLIPHAQIEWLLDTFHDVPLQRPGVIADRISSFARAIAF